MGLAFASGHGASPKRRVAQANAGESKNPMLGKHGVLDATRNFGGSLERRACDLLDRVANLFDGYVSNALIFGKGSLRVSTRVRNYRNTHRPRKSGQRRIIGRCADGYRALVAKGRRRFGGRRGSAQSSAFSGRCINAVIASSTRSLPSMIPCTASAIGISTPFSCARRTRAAQV